VTNELWRVETHCHTHYSKDCLITIEKMVSESRKHGIDRLFITDHNTADGALKWTKLEPELFIPGEEVMTTKGEILALFVKETVPPFLSPEETIERLRDQGAFISVSHPFDRLRNGAWKREDLDEIIELVDAIEIFNARCFVQKENDEAEAYAQEHCVLGTVGSDAHHPVEIGRANLLMQPFEGVSDFALSLKSADRDTSLSPWWVHGLSTVAKWQRKYLKRSLPLSNQS
jgi:predicted metal-dependent phosphoesterase TrpH